VKQLAIRVEHERPEAEPSRLPFGGGLAQCLLSHGRHRRTDSTSPRTASIAGTLRVGTAWYRASCVASSCRLVTSGTGVGGGDGTVLREYPPCRAHMAYDFSKSCDWFATSPSRKNARWLFTTLLALNSFGTSARTEIRAHQATTHARVPRAQSRRPLAAGAERRGGWMISRTRPQHLCTRSATRRCRTQCGTTRTARSCAWRCSATTSARTRRPR